MRLDRLDELFADRVERVQARQRVLEDRADVLAADPAQRLVGQIVDPPALETDLAAGDPARRLEQPDDRQDRKSVVYGKSVSVRVDIGGSRNIKNKKQTLHYSA